jgi:YD repeat-containing protein
MDLAAYSATKVNANGSFNMDGQAKLLHSYTGYDPSNGNILQQTSTDGTTSSYQWDASGSLVTAFTINPGTQQRVYTYEHLPFIGLKSTTDPNGRKSKFEYDKVNRLRITKDHDDNVTARIRYHYKDDPEGLKNDVITTTCAVATKPITFQSPEDNQFGPTTYKWDFGDGNTATESLGTTFHTYASAGSYLVKVRKENPEYYSLENAKVVNVFNTVTSLSLSLTGPGAYDVCRQVPITMTIRAAISGDIQNYVWEYNFNGGSWIVLTSGGGPATQLICQPPPGFGNDDYLGNFIVRCTVTDPCGNKTSNQITLTNYEGNPGCMY